MNNAAGIRAAFFGVRKMRPLVIIPTYNERNNISQLIPAILSVDDRLDILIVDDASPDRTAEVVLESKKSCVSRLHLQSRPGKLGLGSAYVLGFRWGLARGYDFLIQMDADWSHNPADLSKMLQLAEKTDFVVGSRYVRGGGTQNWGAGRKLLSRFGGAYSRMVLRSNFTDFTGGFNGWSGGVLKAIDVDALHSDGYSFQIELKYRADRLGYAHIEFPILFTERRAGKSKMSLSIALEACWRVWKFRWDCRKLSRRTTPGSEPVRDNQHSTRRAGGIGKPPERGQSNNIQGCVPEGCYDNSPALQCRDSDANNKRKSHRDD